MIDNKTLRRAFSRFATGITVVTIADSDSLAYGVTVNSFSSVSLDPPLVLWSLGDATYSLDQYINADAYAINVLSADQQDVSNNFAALGDFDRFESIPHRLSERGLPLIDGCLARFHCQKYTIERVGDHWLFIAEIFEAEDNDGLPLIYYNSGYRSLAD